MKKLNTTILFILPVILLLFIFNTTVFAKKSNTTNTFENAIPATITTGLGPSSIATGLFNVDANLDMAVVNYDSDTVSIFLGDGSGGFGPPTTITLTAGSGPYSIVTGNFNPPPGIDTDLFLDLAIANSNNNTVITLLGDGSGGFGAASEVAFTDTTAQLVPYSITACDFDGDTNTDLVVANLDSDNVSILLGDGLGVFTEDPNSPLTISKGAQPASVAAGDFDGDSIDEVVIANYGLNSVSLISDVNLSITYEYTVGQAFNVGLNPISITTGDFNGDGDLDIATANVNGGNISVLLGYGDNTFTPAINYYAGFFPSSITAADFNGDNNMDLVVTNIDNKEISVLFGSGNGRFQYPVTFPTGVYPISSAAGVFNTIDADTKPDLAVANFSDDTVSILLNNAAPEITVTAPNGLADKHLMSGSSFVISWEADLASESFTILLSTDNGRKFKRIAKGLLKADYETAIDSGKYSYDWTVPIPKKGVMRDCLIKVIGYGTSKKDIIGWDTSDATFSIDIVQVIAPNGGGTLIGGDPLTVTWTNYLTKKPATNVRISYYSDNNRAWNELETIDGSPVKYTGIVPDDPSAKCLIMVEPLSGNKSLGYDISDAFFTIDPAVTVGYPNTTGITLTSGTALTVTWDTDTSMTVTDTVISYSTDNGSTWDTLVTIAGHPSPNTWTGTVPVVTVSSPESLIRVELLDASAAVRGSDVSDNVFTIDP